MHPVVAIIGSADSSRDYEYPVREPVTAAAAAVAIGHELAAQGCQVVVFSGRPDYIEQAVVRGYVASGHAGTRSIHVRGRYGSDLTFDEMVEHPELFVVAPESTADWEVAFYRALLDVDAVVLLGGGRSTFIAGVLALSRRIPVVAVAAFGGAAERVWHRLNTERAHATDNDVSALAQPWQTGTAGAVVAALLAQHERVTAQLAADAETTRGARRRMVAGLLLALVVLLLTLATVPLAFAVPSGGWEMAAVLAAAPLLASVWGALVRNVYDGTGQWLRAAVLGSAAGSVAFLLFVAAQLSTTPDLFASDSPRRLVIFVIAIGFVGGFTSEVVYGKLRTQDVAQTSALPPVN
ncbi:hypothetical protein GCM10010124_37000 [Pilimelia terevasa]|uniref:Uncharacterized protein n=1 Tax=Pilimelia terevasa TaxID=53372 RepID=A0A8J3BTR3_9ACTN|nr:hypothetical protein [Pilimelia terevasa]GGK40753.1 hypothetical protein GCM10010124_37000 [Pilimelia terevasa]